MDAFVQDQAPNAYEKVVDRLLGRRDLGERMAQRWLDAPAMPTPMDIKPTASDMWRWRDWVIDAFNRNMPFDHFTIEQLAGDLLPNATLEQKIATGFNRNHRGNAEAASSPRNTPSSTSSTASRRRPPSGSGLTVGLRRCHNHKYDPLPQKEFYQLFAFFNNVPERGKAMKYGNSPPLLRSPTPDQEEQPGAAGTPAGECRASWKQAEPRSPPIEQAVAKEAGRRRTAEPLVTVPARPGANCTWTGNRPAWSATVRRLRTRPAGTRRRTSTASAIFDVGDLGSFGFLDAFTFSVWVQPRGNAGGTVLSRMTDTARSRRLRHPARRRPGPRPPRRAWLDDAIRVHTEEKLSADAWHHVLVSYDGSRAAAGVTVAIDGKPAKIKVVLDDLDQSFQSKEPLVSARAAVGKAGSTA